MHICEHTVSGERSDSPHNQQQADAIRKRIGMYAVLPMQLRLKQNTASYVNR